jgi:curved DNA-binding protein
MDYKDYYKTLGVDRDAELQEIKRAYRRLAVKYHPDKNPGDPRAEGRFKEINEAYEVLSDPSKRAKYDQLGSSYQQWQRRGGAPSGFDWSQWMGPSSGGVRVERGDLGDLFGGGFSDFFNALFGGMPGAAAGGSGSRGAARSRDTEQAVSISLPEAYHGTTRVLQANGRRLEVKIPPGAKTGTRVRVAGQGRRGRRGEGDLYLRLTVEPDPRFERRGADLHTQVKVDLYTAVLGGEVRVPTLSGDVMLSIPAGSQPGRVFRIKGRGMPYLRKPHSKGDLYAKLDVRLPVKLTAEQRRLFEKLAQG